MPFSEKIHKKKQKKFEADQLGVKGLALNEKIFDCLF
jgi:hypothetical protein